MKYVYISIWYILSYMRLHAYKPSYIRLLKLLLTLTLTLICVYLIYIYISLIVLSQKHPFEHVKSESVLCVTVHMNQRPNLDLDIPKDTPQEVIDMIRYV